MEALTPAERRGALVVVLLLALGTVHDLVRATRPLPAPAGAVAGQAAPAPDPGPPANEGRPPDHAAAATAVIDLNRATARELDDLPGVGPVLAGRIIDHRRRHGPFRQPEELLAVRGIGPRLYARLRSRIVTGQAQAPPGPARSDTVTPR